MAVVKLSGQKLTVGADKIPTDVNILLSADANSVSEVITGEFGGKTLSEYIEAKGTEILGKKAAAYTHFPFSAKLLSNAVAGVVQVNPNPQQDSLWYIVDAADGAAIGLGFKEGISKEEAAAHMKDNTLINDLQMIPVAAGDVLKVEAGTVYALPAGITVLDIQNDAYDEQPVDNVLELLNMEPVSHDHHMGEWLKDGSAKWSCMGKVGSFDADLYQLNGRMDLDADDESFKALIFLDGSAVIEVDDEILHAEKDNCFFVDANTRPFHITGNTKFVMVRIA